MSEHANAAITGTETKYQVIRGIIESGEEWDYEILSVIENINQPYEDFWIYTLICDGYSLANMKAGDAKQAAQNDAMLSMRGRKAVFTDPKAFLDAREREIAEAKARAATAKLNAKNAKNAHKTSRYHSVEETTFAGDFGKTTQSMGIQGLLNRIAAAKKK